MIIEIIWPNEEPVQELAGLYHLVFFMLRYGAARSKEVMKEPPMCFESGIIWHYRC